MDIFFVIFFLFWNLSEDNSDSWFTWQQLWQLIYLTSALTAGWTDNSSDSWFNWRQLTAGLPDNSSDSWFTWQQVCIKQLWQLVKTLTAGLPDNCSDSCIHPLWIASAGEDSYPFSFLRSSLHQLTLHLQVENTIFKSSTVNTYFITF